LNTYRDARNSGDLVKLQSTFHDDGIYISGRGGQFTKETLSQVNWAEEKLELYNPAFEIDDNEAKVTVTAKYLSGTWKINQIYTLVKENDRWLIMRVEQY
jgi:hypothetical protein